MLGLREVAVDAHALGMNFYFLDDNPESLAELVIENNIGAVVTDFFPLREFQDCRHILTEDFPDDVPLIQVDTHNIVPVWMASQMEESGIQTFRPKVTKLLYRYLNNYPALVTFENAPILKKRGKQLVGKSIYR